MRYLEVLLPNEETREVIINAWLIFIAWQVTDRSV
jgi:hypothetical protein